MRVAVYYNNSDVRLEERPVPDIGPDEALLKVFACGICGSDVMEWYRIRRAPLVLGHEVAGEVSQVGERVEKLAVGDRVFVSHHVPCNTCRLCLRGDHTACATLHATNIDPGGFSEFARVPGINVDRGVFPLPEEVSYDAGVFVEPLACVVRSQMKLGIEPGDSVLVLGSGVSGILHAQLARSLGAKNVISTDINEHRLNFAERFVDATIDAREDVPGIARELNGDAPPEHVIVSTVAIPAIRQAFESVDDCGDVLIFAPTEPGIEFPLDLNDVWSRQITITTSYAAAPSDLAAALELIRTKKIEVEGMVTHRFGLADAGEGFRIVAEAGDSMKIIVEPQRRRDLSGHAVSISGGYRSRRI
jgi:L-iditol 2-dehydrogenase